MIPHGDRRDRAVSGGAEDEKEINVPSSNNIVRVFVLGNGFQQQHGRLLSAAPYDELLQCSKRRQFAFQFSESFRRQIGSIDDFHVDVV
ncbi:MAG: hypothetical protein ABIU20_09375 [Blastocatellia bacterium]